MRRQNGDSATTLSGEDSRLAKSFRVLSFQRMDQEKKLAPRCRGLNLPWKHRGAKQIKTQIAHKAFRAPADPASVIFSGTGRTVGDIFLPPTSAASISLVILGWVSGLVMHLVGRHLSIYPSIHPSFQLHAGV